MKLRLLVRFEVLTAVKMYMLFCVVTPIDLQVGMDVSEKHKASILK
jgi:hypothetical protein